jgi:hypothetical protein
MKCTEVIAENKLLGYKCKLRSKADQKGPEEEQRYSSTFSLTSALEGVGG